MLDRITRYGLFAVAAIAPLLFGGARDWVWGPLAVIIALLASARGVAVWTDREAAWLDPRWLAVPGLCFALVFAWIAVQLATGVPEAWQSPLYRAAAEVLGSGVAGRIAIDAELALSAGMRLLCYVGAFWLAASICRHSSDARALLLVIAISAALYAAYGLINDIVTGSRVALWYVKPVPAARLSATYVNPDGYATYAGLGLLVVLSIFLSRLAAVGERGGSDRRARFRHRVDFALGRGIGWLFAAALTAMTLLLSASRAGIAAAFVALLVLIAGTRFPGSRSPLRSATAVSMLLGGLVAIVWIAGARLAGSLGLEAIEFGIDIRLDLYRQTGQAIAVAPWTGWGFGSFLWVYPSFQPSGGIWPGMIFDLAHTTAMEAAVDLGVPAAAVLHVGMLWLAGLCARGAWARQRDAHVPLLAVAASVLVGLHGLVDFPLQMPGTAIVYACILGAGVGQAWSSRREA